MRADFIYDQLLSQAADFAVLPFHPAAAAFPLMKEDSPEFKAFVGDIKAHGQIDAIWTLDGMILIGRNRYNACLAAGLKPWMEPMPEGWNGDPLARVISSNRHRKHLTPMLLAWIALGLAETKHGGAERFQVGTLSNWSKPPMTRAEAADAMGIKVDHVHEAAAIAKLARQGIIDAIEDGTIKTTHQGLRIVTPTTEEKLDGMTSDDKQRAWLASPSNIPWKPRQPKPKQPITDGVLKALTDLEAAALIRKVLPKANRAFALEGAQCQIVPVGGDLLPSPPPQANERWPEEADAVF